MPDPEMEGVTSEVLDERHYTVAEVAPGLEQMPDATMMRYVLRGAGYLQMAYGIVLWVVARDVVRFQSAVVAFIVVFLVGAPAFYCIDAAAGLPGYWCLLDFSCSFLAGAVPLAFWLWPSSPNTY